MLRKREGVRRTRISSTLCVRLHPLAGRLQGSLCRRFLLPPAFHFAGAGMLPGSGLGNRSLLRSSQSAPTGACPACGRRCPCGWTFWFYGVIAGYPMQTVMRLSRYGAEFGNKKSPHNNLNLTIPSGMALVRVCYVAIRKLETCSGSFRSRVGTLSKICYIQLLGWITTKIEPCQRELVGARPLHLAAQDRSVA